MWGFDNELLGEGAISSYSHTSSGELATVWRFAVTWSAKSE